MGLSPRHKWTPKTMKPAARHNSLSLGSHLSNIATPAWIMLSMDERGLETSLHVGMG